MWTKAVAAGMDDGLFWRCTVNEVRGLMDEMAQRANAQHRADTLRAGIVASAVINFAGRVATRRVKPTDFLPRATPTYEQQRRALLAWAVNNPHVKVADA